MVCALVSVQAALPRIQVDPVSGLMVDTDGNYRIFHGVNVVEKLSPFLPPTEEFDVLRSLSTQDLDYLESWGMNVVRLGVLWQAVVPTADAAGHGVVDLAYLASVKALIRQLADRGIYTIVDAHQDNLNARTCGEGIPTWAYDKALGLVGFDRSGKHAFPHPLPFNITTGVNGYPNLEDCQKYQFFEEGLAFQNIAAWNSLYSRTEMHADFAFFWGAVAQALQGETSVLGYELLNEPWISSASKFDDTSALWPMYQAASASIRQWDSETIILFEPLVPDGYLSPVHFVPNFPPGGPEGLEHANRQLFAYHIYCLPFNTTNKDPPKLCRYILEHLYPGVTRDLARYKLGGFMTEFGAVGNDDASVKMLDTHMLSADKQLQSWTYWTYKGFDDITTQNVATETFFFPDGSLQMAKIRVLARPYAPVIAGLPTGVEYNNYTAVLSVIYHSHTGAGTTTRVYTSADLHYPDGYNVYLSPEEHLSWTVDGLFVVVSHLASLPVNSSVKVALCHKGHSCV